MSTMAARDHLAAEFEALDHRLAVLLAHEQAGGRDRSEDPLAGLAIRPSDAAVALRRRSSPGADLRPETACAPAELVSASPLGQLWRRFDLTGFEAFVTVVALSVEIDPRYRTVLAFLLDDASARTPTVALAQRLWAGDGVPAAGLRPAFHPDGRLLGSHLIGLGPSSPLGPSGPALVPLPFRTLHVSDWLVDLALGNPKLPATLHAWVQRHPAPCRASPGPIPAPAARTPLVFSGPDRQALIDAALGAATDPVLLAVPEADAPPSADALALLIRQARADRCGLVLAASVVDAAASQPAPHPPGYWARSGPPMCTSSASPAGRHPRGRGTRSPPRTPESAHPGGSTV